MNKPKCSMILLQTSMSRLGLESKMSSPHRPGPGTPIQYHFGRYVAPRTGTDRDLRECNTVNSEGISLVSPGGGSLVQSSTGFLLI